MIVLHLPLNVKKSTSRLISPIYANENSLHILNPVKPAIFSQYILSTNTRSIRTDGYERGPGDDDEGDGKGGWKKGKGRIPEAENELEKVTLKKIPGRAGKKDLDRRSLAPKRQIRGNNEEQKRFWCFVPGARKSLDRM